MTDSPGLAVKGTVDEVARLRADPPAEKGSYWTVWGVVEEDGDRVLTEVAILQCPECGHQSAYWRNGIMGCRNCQTRERLIR